VTPSIRGAPFALQSHDHDDDYHRPEGPGAIARGLNTAEIAGSAPRSDQDAGFFMAPAWRSNSRKDQMTTLLPAQDAAEAVACFARDVDGRAGLDRVLAKLEGPGGMTSLCAAEAALAARWPIGPVRELVWLTRASPKEVDTLHLAAFAEDGALIHAATFSLTPAAVAV
jgi:hypothetical protein